MNSITKLALSKIEGDVSQLFGDILTIGRDGDDSLLDRLIRNTNFVRHDIHVVEEDIGGQLCIVTSVTGPTSSNLTKMCTVSPDGDTIYNGRKMVVHKTSHSDLLKAIGEDLTQTLMEILNIINSINDSNSDSDMRAELMFKCTIIAATNDYLADRFGEDNVDITIDKISDSQLSVAVLYNVTYSDI